VCYLTIWGRNQRLQENSNHNSSERIFDGNAPADSERTVRASGGGVRNNTIVINNNSNNRTNNRTINNDDDNEKVLSLIIKSMSMEERIGLYRGTFARKQQEMLVDPSWIIAGDTKYHSVGDTTNKNRNKNDNNGDNDSSNTNKNDTNLSIESEEEDINDDDNLASTGHTTMAGTTAAPTGHNLLHPYYIDPANSRGGDHRGAIAVVPGLCVICLEPMLAGETVVCSEKTSCPHLFHKDRLAKFLAHKTKQQERNPRTHKQLGLANPCPTCRQNFVTLDVLPMAFSGTEV